MSSDQMAADSATAEGIEGQREMPPQESPALLSALQELEARMEAERSAFGAERESLLNTVRQLERERDELRPLADVGRQYRADLIEDALAQGVRAYGNEFARETYLGVLEGANIAVIKRMREDWRIIGDGIIVPGRKTQDTPSTAPKERPGVPDAAYIA